MLKQLLSSAHATKVLRALELEGNLARFTDIRNRARIGDTQTSRTLKDLNKWGLAVGRPQADQSMRYGLTKRGSGVLEMLQLIHSALHESTLSVALEADKELEEMLLV